VLADGEAWPHWASVITNATCNSAAAQRNSRCGNSFSRCASPTLTPSRRRNSRDCSARVARSAINGSAGLCAIALVNTPSAAGLATNAKTEVDPAHSPNTVIRSASPSNEIAECDRRTPRPVGDVEGDDIAVRRQPRTVVELQLSGSVEKCKMLRRESTPSPAASWTCPATTPSPSGRLHRGRSAGVANRRFAHWLLRVRDSATPQRRSRVCRGDRRPPSAPEHELRQPRARLNRSVES
jgi:hypothetical protein